jgi:hypothetical protein
VTTSIASDGRPALAAAEIERVTGRASRDGLTVATQGIPYTRRLLHTLLGLLDDAVMLLLVIGLFPLAILLVGAPVALLVRLLIEITKWM